MNAQDGGIRFTHAVLPDDYELPHPPIHISTLLLVRRVILHAFGMLRQRGIGLGSLTEDQITHRLQSIVEDVLRQTGSIEGFNRHTFGKVTRHEGVSNYNGVHPNKEPDLCFELKVDEEQTATVISSQNAIFVECKPVDEDHPAGSKYCDDGIVRFVRGDYAWAMREALMIGYARHGRNIDKHLVKAMNERLEKNHDQKDQGPLKIVHMPKRVGHKGADPEHATEALFSTKHERGFPWPHNKGRACDITLYHVWYHCD